MQATSSTSGSLSPLLLSLAGRVGHAFEVQTMIAGFTCHGRGVELTVSDRRSARALVKSKRAHTVELRVDHGKLLVRCTCPAESMGVQACKHVWAALLEVDRQGGLADLRTRRSPVALELEPRSAPPPAKRTAKPAPAKKKKAAR